MTEKRSVHSLPVSKVMTREVRTASPGTTLAEIGEILVEARCHHVPIVEDGRVVGMISSRDLVDAARARGAASLAGSEAGAVAASEVMTTDLESIDVDGSIDAAIRRIGEGDIHALVVVDADDALVGIVTHRDLLRYLMS